MQFNNIMSFSISEM